MHLTATTLAVAAATVRMCSGMTVAPPLLPGMPVTNTVQLKRSQASPMPHVVSEINALDKAPMPVTYATPVERDIAAPQEEIMSGLTTIFGYLLAGLTDNEMELLKACVAVSSLADSKWARIGLIPTALQAPICNTSNTMPTATDAIVNSIVHQSIIFSTQLINSVNNTQRLATMCRNLNLDLLDYFPVNGNSVKDAVCHAAGTERAPQPENNRLRGDPAAVSAARNTQSILFAILYAANAQTGAELSDLCAQAPEYVEKLSAEHLNGSLVASTLCRFKKPIPIPVAKMMLRSWMTRYYITVLENVSNTAGWRKWLCSNLDAEKMDTVGLNGVGLLQQVCSDVNATESMRAEDIAFDF